MATTSTTRLYNYKDFSSPKPSFSKRCHADCPRHSLQHLLHSWVPEAICVASRYALCHIPPTISQRPLFLFSLLLPFLLVMCKA